MTPHAVSHLTRAKSRLDSSTAEDLVIAALFLRMAMEAMTYKTLTGYAARVPESVLKTWQPPQAVRALLQFEPDANQDFTIEIAESEVPDLSNVDGVIWHHVAKHKALTSRWLSRNYHKVGRLLHAPQDAEHEFASGAETAAHLLEVLSELEDALRNQVVGVPFPIITFECDACGSLVGRNADEFLAGKSAVCLQNDCGAEFLAVTPVGEEIVVKPIQDYPLCTACREPMPIGPRKLNIGAELMCLACGKAHLFVGHNWTYVAK